MSTIKKLKELGYTTVDEGFYAKAREWMEWYQGDVLKFHHYRVRNGVVMVKCKRYTLGMGKKVPEDWANLLLNERVTITAEGAAEQEYLDSVLTANNFWVKGNEMQELAFALGTTAVVPRLVGAAMEGDGTITGGDVELDYPTVGHIFPISWKNGIITECAFDAVDTVNGKKYLYIQIHHKGEDGLYVIDNHLFRYENNTAGAEVELATVSGYENVPKRVLTGSDKRQFVIDRPNIANNIDPTLPLGISVFANAIDAMKGVDIAYDSYVNEFVLGKKRIMVKASALKFINGEDGEDIPAFDANDTTYYVLPGDVDEGALIKEIDMTLRAQEHSTGIQDNLNILSSKCGFGENYYRFSGGSMTTATQVISENSTMFRTMKKHEIILRDVLVELCRIILRLGKAAGHDLDENVKITINFDDSIIEDKTTERNNDRQDMASGILNDWEYRMKYYGEDEATAKMMLPRMQDMVTEPQNEVE